MKPGPIAMPTQPCGGCGALLDTSGSSPGAWLSCPGCGKPVHVKAQVTARPRISVSDELAGTSWVEGPRLSAPKPTADPERHEPPWSFRAETRAGVLQILLLCTLAGVAHTMFAGSFLMAGNPYEQLMTGAFGALVALFVAVMVNTMRWGGSEERRSRP